MMMMLMMMMMMMMMTDDDDADDDDDDDEEEEERRRRRQDDDRKTKTPPGNVGVLSVMTYANQTLVMSHSYLSLLPGGNLHPSNQTQPPWCGRIQGIESITWKRSEIDQGTRTGQFMGATITHMRILGGTHGDMPEYIIYTYIYISWALLWNISRR